MVDFLLIRKMMNVSVVNKYSISVLLGIGKEFYRVMLVK